MLVPGLVTAQTGAITYDRAIKNNYNLPERVRNNPMVAGLPAATVATVVLSYSPTATLLTVLEDGEAREDGDDVKHAVVLSSGNSDSRRMQVLTRMKQFSSNRSDHETTLDAYTDLESGVVTEVREFLGRTFRLTDARPQYNWKLTSDVSEFLGYQVMRATAEHEGSNIEAWFATDIPVAGGPGQFGGLPGMILALTVNEGELVYSATNVDTGAATVEIVAPEEGNEISIEDYEALVAEKLEEMKQSRSRNVRIGRRQ
jgi:GLPGLI family protein